MDYEILQKYAKGIAAFLGVFLSALVGGFDELFNTLVIFIIIDYFSGVAAAWIRGEINSSIGLKGIAKKVFIVCLVVVANRVDMLLQSGEFWRNAVLWGLICNEFFSLLGNGHRMGVKIPAIFDRALSDMEKAGKAASMRKESK